MTRYQKASGDMETRFRMDGVTGGGPLWQGDAVAPRRTFFVWRSNAGIWHAFTLAPYGVSPRLQRVAEGRTRDEAFDRASRIDRGVTS